jgi:hypothetical protein
MTPRRPVAGIAAAGIEKGRAATMSNEDVVGILNEELDTNQYSQFLNLMKKHGVSNRWLARAVGLSEATIRRDLATFDAIRSGNLNEIYGSDIDAASNDASPALKAILRNLPKLTAAERDVVRKELDIADMGAA